MTCPHCRDTGISSGADDLGGPGTMSPCECDAGLAWTAWGGDMSKRYWLDIIPERDTWSEYTVEVVPMSAYRAQRDSLLALLRQETQRAVEAEREACAAVATNEGAIRLDQSHRAKHGGASERATIFLGASQCAADIAAIIRARGETE